MRIWELEKELMILRNILEPSKIGEGNSNGLGRPCGSTKYNLERLDFLKQCEVEGLSDGEIIEKFNKKFGTKFKENSRALYNLMQRQGIRKTGWRFGGFPTKVGDWEKVKK